MGTEPENGMTRDDAIALLEMMRREQRSQSSVPPLRSDAIARRYVNIMSQLLGGSRWNCGPDMRAGGRRPAC